MVGNVWEWCHSLYTEYPYAAGDGREDVEATGFRVLRGGSFNSVQRQVRCAFRFEREPHVSFESYGFRVCVAADTVGG
jgi:formylglycine-generating enzyme required for sulfatase activity